MIKVPAIITEDGSFFPQGGFIDDLTVVLQNGFYYFFSPDEDAAIPDSTPPQEQVSELQTLINNNIVN